MIVIPPQGIFLNRGGLVPEEEEVEAVVHALTNEQERVARGGGNRYGKLSFQQLQELIVQLEQFRNYKGS